MTSPLLAGTLNTKQAAAHLNKSEATLKRWRSKDIGPEYIRIGITVRYRESALDSWLFKNTIRPGD